MKTFILNLKIVFLIVILAVSADVNSQSVGTDNNAALKKTFTAKTLSNYQLKGFETRAIQKVEDFGDYLELISNKEYDLGLRKQAIKMVEKLFVDANALVVNPERELTNKKEIGIIKYVQSALNSNYSKVETNITNIKLSKPLELLKKGNYSGELSFTQNNSYYKDSKLLKTSSINRKAGIVLAKTSKKFGNEKEYVWNVFLVDIRGD